MRKDDRDTGKQTGLYDTDKIRQRVQRWQADSAGAAVPKDAQNLITVEYEDDADETRPAKKPTKSSSDKPRIETDKISRQPSPTKSPKTPRGLDADRQAWIRKKGSQRTDLDTDIKHAGAPLKRVVSDAHWRKDRSPTKTPESAPKVEPKPYTIKRTTVYKSEDPPKPKKDDDGIRVRPMKENDDGIRIIPIDDTSPTQHKSHKNRNDSDRPRSSGTPEQRTPEHQLESRSAREPVKEKKDRRSAREVSRDNSDRRRRLRRRHASPVASEAETEGRSIAQTLDPDDSISIRNAPSRKSRGISSTVHETKKDNSAGQSRMPETNKMSAPNANTTAAPTYGNRIEAWLGGTPDPFVADGSQQQSHGHKEPAACKARSKRQSNMNGIDRRNTSDMDKGDEVRAGYGLSRSSPGEPSSRPREVLETISESRSSTFEDGNSSYATSSVPSDIDLPDVQTSKHTPGANLRRRFPTTGKRLSTIASAETLQEPAAPSEISEQDTIVPEHLRSLSSANGLRRRLTRHEDLMSVLSLPIADSKSIVSARSIRTNRTRLEKATLQDLWNEFTADEIKYQRELRTLVDGVIPVLLSCVLSKSDSAIAVGLFGRSANDDVAITKPIVDMGVALERLKAHHRRAPKSDNNTLLSWAQGAIRIYHDYLKAWRMGFQDVVVNLAPADANTSTRWDDGLLRNEDGDLVNGDGERVDVAFLLKRPLVRLKYLAKTFKGINILAPSALAGSLAEKYQGLVTEARRRSNEERARLEDEAAAAIDPTRARDPRSLGLLKGVSIDATRCVHARDYFDMNIIHSSGQQLDCRVELIIRDDCPGRGNGGDVLVCEVSDTGRWLLFPPLSRDSVSARSGNGPGDVVMMIRGLYADKKEWHELLSLRASDEATGPEWVEMLGLNPVPPSLARQSSFLTKAQTPSRRRSQGLASPTGSPTYTKEIEIPIGERPGSSRSWISDHSGQGKPVANLESGRLSNITMPTSLDKVSQAEMSAGDSPGLRRSRATRHKSSPPMSPSSSRPSLQYPTNTRAYPERPTHHMSRTETGTTLSSYSSQSTLSQSKKEYSVWMPSSTISSDESEEEREEEDSYGNPPIIARPQVHRRTSSLPVVEPLRAPNLRQRSEPNSPIQPVEIFDLPDRTQHEEAVEPSSAPAKLQKRRPSVKGVSFDDILGDASSKDKDLPPPKPKRFSIPSFTPNFLKRHRRSSSPLKHEYEPSISSESSTESDLSYSEDDDESITSDSSEEAVEGAKNVVPLDLPLVDGKAKATPPESLASLPTATLGPSNSASQAPYRTVPHQTTQASKIVASIYSWSDRGAWELLHPSECVVLVTPGLIEAFDIEEAIPDGSDMTSPSARGVQPLIAFEVTPLVPLRRGTALDISIRSPPTASSLLRASNNVMFRSRSAEECDMLYSFINTARINNPTYIALQHARGPANESAWSAAMNRDNNQKSASGSWFHNPLRRSNTYRSKTSRAPSEVTDSSVGTMNTAFSALRRFNGNSRLFNIAKSTITSRQGSRTGTSESLSSGASTPIVYDSSQGTPLGITNAKIRLYIRESQNKWRDMGSARLSILLPPRPSSGVPPSPRSIGLEKRILISGKTRGETLLDVTLGESCFERVARTGIAVSVWEDRNGPVTSGGVLASKANTYMIQHKTERECAYTFGLVGKLRY
ncbi:EBP-domain-containing protein, partial [Aureobasidium melanogenum]